MDTAQIRTIEVILEELFCIKEDDGVGQAEPYIWSGFINFSGHVIKIKDLVDPFEGAPEYQFNLGSHRNLAISSDSDPYSIGQGDTVNIPSTIGRYYGDFQGIKLPDWMGIPPFPPLIGIMIIINEQDETPSEAVELGHQALNKYIKDVIDDLVSSIILSDILSVAMTVDSEAKADFKAGKKKRYDLAKTDKSLNENYRKAIKERDAVNRILHVGVLDQVYVRFYDLYSKGKNSIDNEEKIKIVLNVNFDFLKEILEIDGGKIVEATISGEIGILDYLDEFAVSAGLAAAISPFVGLFNFIKSLNQDDKVGAGFVIVSEKDIIEDPDTVSNENGYVYKIRDNNKVLEVSLGKGIFIGTKDGDGSYYVRGKIKLSPPRIPIDELPSEQSLEVKKVLLVSRRFGKVISHLSGTYADGSPWIVTKRRAIELVRTGLKSFYVKKGGEETKVELVKDKKNGKYYLRGFVA